MLAGKKVIFQIDILSLRIVQRSSLKRALECPELSCQTSEITALLYDEG